MNINNFLNFAILVSCFIGAFFSILKFNHVVDIMIFFLLVSFAVSIILKFGISMVVKYTKITRGNHFSNEYDEHLEKLRVNINNLEKRSHAKIEKIHELGIGKMVQKRK